MEKAYRTMKNSGAGSIVIGIIILVTGVAAGFGGLFSQGKSIHVIWYYVQLLRL